MPSRAAGGGAATAGGDFDGDGYQDLAVSAASETVGSIVQAGNVTVLYGTASGLGTTRARTFRQGLAPVGGAAEDGDLFGSTLATGDFNGDGYGDLAVAAQWETLGSAVEAGNVTVLYGSATGLGSRAQTIAQGSGAPGVPETDDVFGFSLAAPDMDGDGYDELAIGASDEDVGSVVDAGNVTVLQGSAAGLTASGARILRQGASGVPGVAERSDLYGWSLGLGDFDGDGRDDLAVGAFAEDAGTIADSGNVSITFGQPDGSPMRASQVFNQTAVGDTTNVDDTFGWSVAGGDVTGDGTDDLVVGAAFDDEGGVDAGSVGVLRGSPTGLAATGMYVPETTHGAFMGYSLATADLGANGTLDVLAGEPNWSSAVGRVNLITFDESSVIQFAVDQSTFGGALELHDAFGASISTGDYDGNGVADVVVGAHVEDVGSITDAGNVSVGYGAPGGHFGKGVRAFNQSHVGQAVEAYDNFGFVSA